MVRASRSSLLMKVCPIRIMACFQERLVESIMAPISHLLFAIIMDRGRMNIVFCTNLSFLVVNLNHFRLLRVVGKGAFGKVRIVERKDTGLTFALKYIRKDESQLLASRCGLQ